MATKFPLILNNIKFQVNPKNIRVTKPLVVADVATQAGIKYQIWYNQPELIVITGISAGDSAYKELMFLKQNFEVTSSSRLSQLFYKTTIYTGFIRKLEVGHNLDEHLRFPYTIDFQLVQGQKFNIEDFALQPEGALSRATSFLEDNINAPISRFENSLDSVFKKLI
jgi:hypothetical protein